MDAGQLASDRVNFFLKFFSLNKYVIELGLQFLILVFHMAIGILNIFRPGVDSQLIKRDVIVSKSSFKISHLFNELVPSTF